MAVDPNSKLALKKVLASGVLSKNQKRMMTEIITNGPGTNRELDARIGHGGRSWHPILHNLEKTGAVQVLVSRPCLVSGHRAKVYSVTGNLPTQRLPKPQRPSNAKIQAALDEVDDLSRLKRTTHNQGPSGDLMEVLLWLRERYAEK